MENKLDILLEAINNATAEHKMATKPNTMAFWREQLRALKDRLSRFGQRNNIVMVTFTGALPQDDDVNHYIIYYSGISSRDAINYTKRKLQGWEIEYQELSALEVTPGKPIKKVNS